MIKIKNKHIRFKLREERAILLACMGISLIFWLLVKLSQTYQTEKEVQLEFAIPEEKTFSIAPPQDLRTQIEATGWDLILDYFSHPKVTLFYNMMDYDRLDLNRGQLRTDILRNLSSNDIRVIEVNYDALDIVLEEKSSRKVPVILVSDLSFARQYQLQEEIQVEPDSIVVSGPVSKLNPIMQWPTDSLILKDLKASQTRSVNLVKAPRELTLSVTKVEARIQVEQFTEKALFIPVQVVNSPYDSLKIFPENIKLSCVVGLSRYNELKAEDFLLEVSLSNLSLSKGKNTAPVNLKEYPLFVRNIKFSPQSVEFFVLQPNE